MIKVDLTLEEAEDLSEYLIDLVNVYSNEYKQNDKTKHHIQTIKRYAAIVAHAKEITIDKWDYKPDSHCC